MTKINCEGCGGKCCRQPNVYIPLDEESEGRIPDELKDVREGMPVMRSSENGCAALSSDGRCGIYDIRPLYCAMWPIRLKARTAISGMYSSQTISIEPEVVQCDGDGVPAGARANEILAENSELIERAMGSLALRKNAIREM